MTTQNSLENQCQDIHTAHNKELPKENIYHYTDFKALESILKQRKLRYTDYRFFNDPTEFEYGKNLALKSIVESGKFNDRDVGITRDLLDNIDKHLQIYVCCFSEEYKKLSLWRYYSSSGTGCAIGFNENFHKITDTIATAGAGVLSCVTYGDKSSLKILNKFIDVYPNNSNKNDLPLFVCNILPLIPTFKDDSFKDEHEVRIFYMEGKLLSFNFDDKYREFISIQTTDLPFVNSIKGNKPILTPQVFNRNDISEILIGPACEFEEARCHVVKLLRDNDYDINKIKIIHSSLPSLRTQGTQKN